MFADTVHSKGLDIGTEQRPSIVGDCFGLTRFVVIGKIIGNATLANKLKETFLNDATIRIDRNNRIFYVDNTAESRDGHWLSGLLKP
jgi:hypothetical protein